MNIWYLHPTAGGPGVGRHWRPYWLADAWNGMGHRAIVVCAAFHHLMSGAARPAGHARIADVDYWFVRTPTYCDNGLGRLRNNVAYARQLAAGADETARRFGAPDLVVASTPHLFHVQAARRVARRFGAKFWVEVRDLWPDSIVALGLARRWHPLVILMARQERRAYRSAEQLVSLLAGAEPHMRSRGVPPGRFLWVPNGVSESEITQAAAPPAIEHPVLQRIQGLRGEGKQIVVYAGAMGPPNAVEIILGAGRDMKSAHPEIHVILAGGGIDRHRHRRAARELTNLEFVGELERPIAHALLRASDCAVIVLRRNALYRHGISPNKLFDASLFAPRNVVACEAAALMGLEDLVGTRCEPEDAGALSSSIVATLASPPRPLEERIAALRKFSYSLLAARYLAAREGANQS